MITISEERYKELLKIEARVELMLCLYHRDHYFNRNDFIDLFIDLFDSDYKKEEEA